MRRGRRAQGSRRREICGAFQKLRRMSDPLAARDAGLIPETSLLVLESNSHNTSPHSHLSSFFAQRLGQEPSDFLSRAADGQSRAQSDYAPLEVHHPRWMLSSIQPSPLA